MSVTKTRPRLNFERKNLRLFLNLVIFSHRHKGQKLQEETMYLINDSINPYTDISMCFGEMLATD